MISNNRWLLVLACPNRGRKTMNVVRILLIAFLSLSTVPAFAQVTTNQPSSPQNVNLDALIQVLKDDNLRGELLRRLEAETPKTGEATAANPAGAEAAAAPAEPEKAAEEGDVLGTGLLTGVTEWAADLGQRLPTAALGAPIDVKVAQARSQIAYRLEAPGAVDELKEFGWRSILGWAIITVIAFAAMAITRARVRRKVVRKAAGRALVGDAVKRSTLSLLPLIACIVVAVAWVQISPYTEFERSMFVLLTVPLASGLAANGLLASGLVLLVGSKGARLVAYAQKKLSPLVGLLIGIAVAGSVAATSEMRIAIGPASGDILSLLLDLAVPVFAIYIIITHRRTIRSLIVRGYSTDDDAPILDRAIHWVGTHWQYFGFLFAILNIGARIFGTRSGNFLAQSSLSVALIVVAFIGVTSIRRFEEKRAAAALRRPRSGVRVAVLGRFSLIIFRALQMVACAAAALLIFRLWGIDVFTWLTSSAGASVGSSLLSIAMVMLVAWMLWVVLDAWISAALAPPTGQAQRERSARVKTLLPLLRNVAFVVLSVLTVIGVLSNLGINVAPLIAGAGVVGLAVGFGSQQLVQDVITGLFILLEDTLAIGDSVNTGDRSGTVEALTIRTVKIRDGDGALHSIPFSTIKALKNSSRGYGVYTVSVTLALDADVETAIQLFKDVGEEVRNEYPFKQRILLPLDVWGVDQITPEGIVLKGAVRTHPLQQYGVGREINRRLHARLHEKGVALANKNPFSEKMLEAEAT